MSLQREDIGDFPDAEQLVEQLQNRFDVVANALRWPNFLYAAVIRDDSTSVYIAFDHSNVDAYSIQRIPAEVHELYAAAVEGRPGKQPTVGSYVDFCEIERAGRGPDRRRPRDRRRWREFITRCNGKLPNFPVTLAWSPAAPCPRRSSCARCSCDAESAAAFESYCRPFGGSLVGMLAATSLIVNEIGGQPVYRAVVPFHTRVKSKWSNSVGWYVGGAPIEIPIDRAPDFHSALKVVRAELQANKSLARMPLARVLRLLGSDFRPTSPDLYSIVSFVDARGIAGAERWDELAAYGLLRVSYGDQVCIWLNRLHEGLWFTCRYPDTDVAYKNMRLYTERLGNVILEVAREQRARELAPHDLAG